MGTVTLVALTAGILTVTGALSGGGSSDEAGRTVAPAPSGGAPERSGPPPVLDRPSATEVQALLSAYRERYSAEDASGLGALFTDDGVRHNAGDPPEDRTEAMATYREQFARLTDPVYELDGVRIATAPGAAIVRARYRITSASGPVTGAITYHLVERSGDLAISRLEIAPD